MVPQGAADRAVSALLPRSREYMLVAMRQGGRWVFNPADDQIVGAGTALVLMTSAQGRLRVERLLDA